MRDKTEHNLAVLERDFPHVCSMMREKDNEHGCTYVQDGLPNIVLNKRHFHAPRNPRQEAFNLVKDLHVRAGALYVFMGIGLGYHIEKFKELYRELIPEITVVCIERSVSAFRVLVNHRDISFLEGTHLFVGDETERIGELFRDFNPLGFSGHRIVKLRGGHSLFEGYYREIETLIKRFLSGRLSDLLTMCAFDTLWMRNTIDNIPQLIGKSSILALKDILKGRPALVVGAGPSLRLQLEAIAAAKNRIFIIAVDTALEPLFLAGIVPDFVVAIDAQYPNFLDFFSYFMEKPAIRETVLVSDLIVYPNILNHWRNPLFFSSTALPAETQSDGTTVYQDAHPIISKFKSFYPHTGRLRCGGSVATTAIELAIHTGADPVLLAGLDFSYTGFMSHVSSSPSYNLHYRNSNRFRTVQTAFTEGLAARKTVPMDGIKKETVLSDFIFQNYLSWFDQRTEYRGRVFNATFQGTPIPGIEWVELEHCFHKLRDIQGKPAIPSSHLPLPGPAARRFLLSVKQEVKGAREMIAGGKLPATDLMNRFPLLRNSVALTSRLYREEKDVRINLLMLLAMLEKRSDRALERIGSS